VATGVRWRISRWTIYTEKLLRRGHWVPAGLQAAGADTWRARDLIRETSGATPLDARGEPAVVDGDASLFELISALDEHPRVTVVDRAGTIGDITREDIAAALRPMGTGHVEWPSSVETNGGEGDDGEADHPGVGSSHSTPGPSTFSASDGPHDPIG
jgi:hypothetical protein